MPDGALQARARVLNYIKARERGRAGGGAVAPSASTLSTANATHPCLILILSLRVRSTSAIPALLPQENDLWGATPFATFVHLGLHNQAAWNATALAATSALLHDGAGDSPEEFEELLARAAGPALDTLHKVVCIAYYLPDK